MSSFRKESELKIGYRVICYDDCMYTLAAELQTKEEGERFFICTDDADNHVIKSENDFKYFGRCV